MWGKTGETPALSRNGNVEVCRHEARIPTSMKLVILLRGQRGRAESGNSASSRRGGGFFYFPSFFHFQIEIEIVF